MRRAYFRSVNAAFRVYAALGAAFIPCKMSRCTGGYIVCWRNV